MDVQPSRFDKLHDALLGYERTGVPLVAYDGVELMPAGFTDDLGIYDLIPRIAHLLDVPVPRAIDLFLVGIVLVSLVAGLAGVCFWQRSPAARLWAAGLLGVLAFLCLRWGDVYVVAPGLTIALVPAFLALSRHRGGPWLPLFGLGAGLLVGAAHWVRVHSATAVLLFVVVALAFDGRHTPRRRLLVLGLLAAGWCLPSLYFHSLIERRDAYLSAHRPGYVEPLTTHPRWHSIYIGLGFLDNDHGITYLDETAMATVARVAPDAAYLSDEYEAALRSEVATIARTDPGFVVRTLLAKAEALLRLLLLYANVGLVLAFARRKPVRLEAAFWVALGFTALPGVLVMPFVKYLLGFVAFAALYGAAGIECWDRGRRVPRPAVGLAADRLPLAG